MEQIDPKDITAINRYAASLLFSLVMAIILIILIWRYGIPWAMQRTESRLPAGVSLQPAAISDVAIGPDGYIYLDTSNTDG